MEELEEHLPWIRRIANKLFKKYGLKNQGGDVEELVNIGYEALAKARMRYDCNKKAELKTFAYKRVEGEMLNFIIKKYKLWYIEPPLLDEPRDEETPGSDPTESVTSPRIATPEESLLEKDRISALEDCVKQLPSQLREVWNLRCEGVIFETIARVLGIGVSTAKLFENRVIMLMRACLEGKGWYEERGQTIH